eukprot:TRINITY_DN6688_c0_g2_i1.p1 TRINITY_DN6688_c0_g2~~TRINITY_DN6688_c0_g2_i1.p1  ORF type:complete len:382 (+),score=21.56 TRINITY_DN6688_c0_g2_i1:228-1373(+)
MGTSCTKPLTTDSVPCTQARKKRKTVLKQNQHHECTMSPQDILRLAKEVIMKYFDGDIDPVVLSTLAIVESRGCPNLVNTDRDSSLTRVGLCQLSMFRCQQIYKEREFNCFGEPTISNLKDPKISLYFGAARVWMLQRQGGQKHDEEFVVRHFRADKRKQFSDLTNMQLLWQRYCLSRRKMASLYRAIQRTEKCEVNDKYKEVMHVIREGENVKKIANMCMIEVADIMAQNKKVVSPEFFRPGDCISIPIQKSIPRLYVARRGESISSIAHRNSLTLGRLLKANPDVVESDVTFHGQLLRIPGIRGDSQSSMTFGTNPCDSGMMLMCCKGETISSICEQFQVSARDVVVLNDLDDWWTIRKGQKISIPQAVSPSPQTLQVA